MNAWLAVDIGNTAVKLGLFGGERPVRHVRVAGTESVGAAIDEIVASAQIVRCGIASVVPATAHVVRARLESHGLAPLIVGPRLVLPFGMGYRTPETLGADRLAAAAGAWRRAGLRGPVVAVDAGTAITYEVIDRTGLYRGGAIAPGPALMAQALRRGTAQLPEVPLEGMPDAIGDETRTAIQAGILYGFVDAVAGMLQRICRSLDDTPYVVVTGGWAGRLAEAIPAIDEVDRDLVLRGIRDLMALNAPM